MNRRNILVIVVVVILIVSGFLFVHKPNNSNSLEAGKKLPDDVIRVTYSYIQAREDSMGADMSSPTSWVESVKASLSDDWYRQLQPAGSSSTGSTPYNFTFAHQKGYIVKAHLSNCGVNDIIYKPTDTRAVVVCSLEDDTIIQKSGQSVPASELPAGWVYVGKQTPPQVVVVKQDGKWLVDGDATGQGQ